MQAEKRRVVVGLDFGGTIGGVESGYLPEALESVRAIVGRFGPESVFIVSKASESMAERVLGFLEETHFFEETRFLRENVRFVPEYIDKLTVVNELRINYFVDDAFKVVQYLVESPYIVRIFYLSDRLEHAKLLDRGSRDKVVFSTWRTVRKGILK